MARPLARTRVHPNHVTATGMLVGLVAALCYASGTPRGVAWGGVLYVASAILDHVDGQLARMTGKTSASGQVFDRFADLVVRFTLFAGMGLGLRSSALGPMAIGCGLAAGASFVTIFMLRSAIANLRGWGALDQPSWGGFELEDVLYVIAPVTWFGWLLPFVIAAGFGTPLFVLWQVRTYRVAREAARTAATTAPDPSRKTRARLVVGGRR